METAFGTMGQFMRAIGSTIKCRASVDVYIKMAHTTRANG